MKPQPKLIAAASIICVSLTMGTYTAFSVYVGAIAEKFGVEISSVVFIFTLISLCGMLASLFLGNLIKMFGIKKLIVFEGIASLLFFLSLALAPSMTIVYVCAFLFGIINGGFGVCQTEISIWFAKGQGTLISLLSVGMGITAMIMSPLVSSMVLRHGLSPVCLVHGLLMGCILILLRLFVMAEAPEKYGMHPVGYDPSATVAAETGAATLSIGSILKMAPFWLIVLSGGLFNFINGGIVGNSSIIYQSIGADVMQASMCISIFNGVLLAFSTAFGVISDRKGPSLGVLLIGASTIIGSIAAITTSGFSGAVITACFLSACSVCGTMAPISIVRVFGPAQSGSLIGYCMVAASIGQMIAPPLAARIYEGTGTFSTFMIISIVLSVIIIACMFAATSAKAIKKVEEARRAA